MTTRASRLEDSTSGFCCSSRRCRSDDRFPLLLLGDGMDPCGRAFLVSAVMKSTPASMTGIVIRQSILQRERERLPLRSPSLRSKDAKRLLSHGQIHGAAVTDGERRTAAQSFQFCS